MSKFWTWNGSRDRKHDLNGLPSLPADFTTRGMEHGRGRRGSKMTRKPLPLQFHQGVEPQSRSSSRSNDTIALHDAAIKSATNLMAVMSDCLNSPQLSAHLLSAQQHSACLKPMYGRPRSRTAPSTPLVEAPYKEPVELEGSTPIWTQSATRQSLDAYRAQHNTTIGQSIIRPHSSPQDISYKLPVYPPHGFDRNTSNPQLLNAPPQTYEHVPPPKTRTPLKMNLSGETLVAPDLERPKDRRWSMDHKSEWHNDSEHMSWFNMDPHTGERQPAVQAQRTRKDSKLEPQGQALQSQDGLERIVAMRASHEAHLTSLKAAHDNEIASHLAYIKLLEAQRQTSQVPQAHNDGAKKHLTLDTNRPSGRNSGTVYSDTSATPSLKSFEQSLEHQKRTSSEMAAEMEALKRKLSLCRRSQADLGDVRGERDGLRDIAAKNDRRIAQLKDIVRKAKENEKIMKARTQRLEASLTASNMERIDVLQGFYEACEQVDKLRGRERVLVKERNVLRCEQSTIPEDSGQDLRGRGDTFIGTEADTALWCRYTPGDESDLQELIQLRQLVAEKDAHILRLEAKSTTEHYNLPARDSVEALVRRYEQQTTALKAECDQYNTLLHLELRRQARSTSYRTEAVTPQIEHEAATVLARKLDLATQETSGEGPMKEDNSAKMKQLEQELQHCYQEIIMYKLDVRGYKKDLKIMQTDNDALRSRSDVTVSSKMCGCGRRNDSAPAGNIARHDNLDHSAGLGILHAGPPGTPPSTVASLTASALLTASMTPTPAPNMASPLRPITPLGKHKKLPKPPPQSRTPSPNTGSVQRVSNLQRQETLRSLSESIISSYAKRGTPEQETEVIPPLPTSRGRRSAPPPWRTPTYADRVMGGHEATAMSVTKISGEVLRTPTMGLAGAGN
ncbi:uncharacterized protein CLAFUR5_12676 [Fulvia fulva]|uniref:Uncharacterized protein n=1 Tax=Passalora fulva TaxID=5499 RepID=A0A9Q8UV03_PASFU|nr:uncharacterized protein CLAFUR5_12676 [Fulvia fulva]UJO23322.1 hypothetical protein CLAFUR5_12676 [Fulvia fulva]WPV36436.1 hypothetical protein CLAFUW7_12816 [Fulvia fulva]